MTEKNMILAENLTICRNKKTILNDIHFQIKAGAIVVLLGSNGSGKSTLLKTIANLLPFQNGKLQIQEKEIKTIEHKTLCKWISYTAQNNDFELAYRVFDFVSLGRYPHKGMIPFLNETDKKIINQALQTTDLISLADKNVNQLSGGELQRVLLARALATEAPIMLLDEPTSSLDIKHQLEFFKILKSLRDAGKTILIAIHNVNDAIQLGDKLLLLNQGKIVFDGPPDSPKLKECLENTFQVTLNNQQKFDFTLK